MRAHASIFFVFACFCTFTAFFTAFFPGATALAQRLRVENCSPIREEIIPLRPPFFETLRIWDAVYGEDGMEKIADAIVRSSTSLVVAGEYTKGEGDNVYHPFLAEIDRRGRAHWETKHDSKYHKTVAGLLEVQGGYVLYGDVIDLQKGYGLYLAHYNQEGVFRFEKFVFEKGGDLDAQAIVPTSDGTGFMVSAQYSKGKDQKEKYGLIFRLDGKGNVAWRRAYRLGRQSFLYGITGLEGPGYLVSGAIEIEDGRLAGWLLKINENGSLAWQRHFPRGKSARIYKALMRKQNNSFLFLGQAQPLDDGLNAGWVAAVDSTGNLLWQRFYRGGYSYAAHDALLHEDGRSTVLLKGEAFEDAEKSSHVSLLTLSPRGGLMNVEAFMRGHNAHAYKLKFGPEQQRIILGHAQTSQPDMIAYDDVNAHTFDGWVTSAPALERYKDPCNPGLSSFGN